MALSKGFLLRPTSGVMPRGLKPQILAGIRVCPTAGFFVPGFQSCRIFASDLYTSSRPL